jgi:hypothetical protein
MTRFHDTIPSSNNHILWRTTQSHHPYTLFQTMTVTKPTKAKQDKGSSPKQAVSKSCKQKKAKQGNKQARAKLLPSAESSPTADMSLTSEPAFGSFSAKDYAVAVFGEAESCEVLTADPEQSRSMTWESGCQRVKQTLALYNIQADICRSRFKPTHVLEHCCRMINPPKKFEGRAVRFFCTKCMERKIASLVAVGVFRLTKEKQEYLEMKFLFPHNSNCCSDKQHAVQPSYTVVDFDFKTVIGSTYDDVLREVCKQEVGSKKLMGSLINFDVKRHNTDDRRYFPLPYQQVSSMDHKHCMTRLLLHLSVKLNFVEESVTALFDMDAANCDRQWTNYPVRVNADAHLFLSEISLLFGGHNLKKNGPAQHQRCHVDVDGLKGISALEGKTKPGSLILPLQDFRSIFIGSGLLTLSKGQYIYFKGDVVHRGCTYDELSWHPAIHLHLDTRHHKRKGGVVEFTDEKEMEAMDQLRFNWNAISRIMADATANGWTNCLALAEKLGIH